MITQKYNPLTHLSKGKKTDKGKKGKKQHSYTTNLNLHKKGKFTSSKLFKLFIFAVLLITGWVIFNNFIKPLVQNLTLTNNTHDSNSNTNSNSKILPKSLVVSDGFDLSLIPDGDKIVENFENGTNNNNTTTTSYSAKYIKGGDNETELKFFNLDPADQNRLCSNKSDQVIGYRNAVSGATFRFQKVDPTSNDELYFLLGSLNDGKVVQVGDNDDLELHTKSSTESKQHFIRKSTKSGTHYFIPSSDMGMKQPRALQYEFEHLSLRLVNVKGQPYDGQTFFMMSMNEQKDINKSALLFGISTPHLDKDDLLKSSKTTVVIQQPSGSTSTNGPSLTSNLTSSQSSGISENKLKSAISDIKSAISSFEKQTSTQQNNTLGTSGKPFEINLNLSDMGSSSSFTNVSNKDAFNNLRGNEDDVRTLLNRFTNSSADFGNNNLAGVSNTPLPSLGDDFKNKLSQAAAGTSFRGCPTIDRSKYVTKRQLSRCYGCNMDSSLQ